MIKNPFLIKGYVSPEYFCDREEETKKIISALINGRDITLVSLRRMGKTGLLHHISHQNEIQEGFKFIYCDVYKATNLPNMINILGNAVLSQLEKTTEKTIKKIKHFFSSFVPTISINPITFQTEVDFRIENTQQAEITIQQIFSMIAHQNSRVILIIDEFQQIENFPEKNTEAILRTHIQQTNNLNLVFSGSSKHILSAMFSHRDRPFYQSTQLMELGKINEKKYIRFIQDKFTVGNTKISDDRIVEILHLNRNHTYYVQNLCNRLFERAFGEITSNLIIEELNSVVQENEPYYFGYRNLLTKQQFQLIRAIAKANGVEQPSSHHFISKYNLGSSSTINDAIKSLMNKELIFKENNIYHVYDVYFSYWLKNFL